MMPKVIPSLAVFLILLSSCKKESDANIYTIKGRLLDNCQDQVPLGQESLFFLLDQDADNEQRYSKTDDDGYFEYTFNGPPDYSSQIAGHLQLGDGQILLAGISPSAPQSIDAGTLYRAKIASMDLSITISGSGFTYQDTVFYSFIPKDDLRGLYADFVGPFDPEQNVIKQWTRFATSSDRELLEFLDMPVPNVPRLNGVFGTVVYWQLSRNGQLGEVNKEELLLQTCETQGSIRINLDL